MENNIIEQCQKCAVLEREVENIKEDIEDMRVDMKVLQKMSQEMQVNFGKLEVFMTAQFLHFTNKLDEIIQKMNDDCNTKKEHKFTFLGQFIYPLGYGAILFYIAWKLSK